MDSMNKERNLGIELLRIILMVFIIEGHFLVHTGLRESVDPFSAKWSLIWIVQALTVSAVNGFVLISGFYQRGTTIKLHKGLRLWGEVIFYSVALFILLVIFKWGG